MELQEAIDGLRNAQEAETKARGELEKKINTRREARAELDGELEKALAAGDQIDNTEEILPFISSWSESWLDRFRREIAGKVGEQVLIVTSGKCRTIYGGPGSDEGLVHRDVLTIGELASDDLIIDLSQRGVVLPLALNVVVWDMERERVEVKQLGDPVVLAEYTYTSVSFRSTQVRGLVGKYLTRVTTHQLYIGEAEVREWFEGQRRSRAYKEIVRTLNLENIATNATRDRREEFSAPSLFDNE